MATMNVSLPDKMKVWVESQTQSGNYSNVSDYVRDLIRHDQDRKDKITNMQMLVTEAVEGGVSNKSMKDILKKAGGKSAN
jgi:antitoxin ParD1/3/4